MNKPLQTKSFLLFLSMAVLLLLFAQTACISGSKNVQKKQPIILKPDLPSSDKSEVTPPNSNTTVPQKTVTPTGTKLPPPPENPVKVHKEPAVIDTTAGRLLPKLPPVFSVAVMLPFGARNYQPNAAMDSVPENSNLALEFYEGMLLAFDKLKQEGISLKVNVLDTENNPDVAARLLQTPELQAADVIVGPVYNKELKPVAAFAQQNKIPMIAPLSPSGGVTRQNPYYLLANPSIEAQCAAIYRYIATGYGKKRIIAVCTNKPNETTLADLFFGFSGTAVLPETRDVPPVMVNKLVYAFQNQATLESYLSAAEDNMVVVTSFDPLLIHDLTSKLNQLRSKYRITLFGMPNWLNLETIDFGYMANLNLHLPLPFFQNKLNPANTEFKRNYFYTFQTQPTEYACRGYDLMLWLGRALQNNGKNFIQNPHEVNPAGIYTNFVFEPTITGQYAATSKLTTPDYLENRFVNIVRYRPDFMFEVVNK
ncbi:amino acid ABC transporter substrate-binding protein [Sphingobacteriales bacterium UPWRP_1]|nr:hypothetical protein BVG80_05625 [Sphingobacteriales bacterium TSM_CSM]PSJ77979.1 amino acid ABC transporter substrate-binding protein [Sphingobacteriales bacterium UPWRP_1]